MTEPQQQIGPSPLPEQWTTGIAQLPDGSKQVIVQIAGPAGVKVSFLPPDIARQVGEQLVDHARQARSGLIVPTGVQMPSLPNGQQP